MFRIAVTVLLVLMCASSICTARDDEFNVDFYCGWDGHYRPMQWTPIEIPIASDLTEPFGGTFIISAPQDGLNTLSVIRNFVLTPDRPQILHFATKLTFGMGKCNLAIRDKRGRLQWDQEIDMWDFSAQNRLLRVVQEHDLLIGVVGQSRFGLLRVPRETQCLSDRGEGKVYVGRKVARMTPWDWTGYVSLDALILYDPDWTLLRHEQVQAICEWVSNGGTLLLVLGRHPLPGDSPLAQTIPFHIGEPRQLEIPSEMLRQWRLDPDVRETVTAWPLFSKPDAVFLRRARAGEGGYVYGVGHVGFGRVAVMAFDPAELSQGQAAHSAGFWTTHIGWCLRSQSNGQDGRDSGRSVRAGLAGSRGRTIAVVEEVDEDAERGSQRPRQYDNRYRISTAHSASNRIMEHLYSLAEMRPLSIWWVILTLTLLALLLGPVDYMVLKRWDRLPYTWLTSTGWIALFTIGAYYGVQALRGGNMQLRAVSVLDDVADSNCAWATYYTGLFSPRSADYQLEGLGADQWWSGVAPSQEEMWAHQRESAMRQIRCLQEDGASLPVSVPINIWTVQSLLTEFPLADVPFTAEVERTDGELAVEITNASEHRIGGGCVLVEDAYIDIGAVPAGATRRFERPPRPFNPWRSGRIRGRPRGSGGFVQTMVPQYPGSLRGVAVDAFLAQGCFERTLAMHTYLESGAALVCVQFEEAPVPFGVRNRSYEVDHVQLARKIVFPRDGSKEQGDD
ncbi:MAG: hypothetical protein ACYTAS_03600 [Planctomycetota bacterium]|jgi:hypothetical protein